MFEEQERNLCSWSRMTKATGSKIRGYRCYTIGMDFISKGSSAGRWKGFEFQVSKMITTGE